jgi:hypothetical protein
MQFGNQGQITRVDTELRDVALASMIMLSGGNVQEYDFPYLKILRLNQNSYLSYNYFGFSDNNQRDAAFKKFKESQEKKKEEKK